MTRAILVFVKHPEPGRVKTRLAATLGAEEAARVYRRLADTLFAQLPRDVEIIAHFDPPEHRAEIVGWLGEKAARFLPQCAGDLGARLERAFAEAFATGFERIAVIGTDCVEMDARTFHETWTALDTHDAVLGPSEDGGYYLLALRTPCPALFADIDWSTSRVLDQTLARAAAAHLRVHLLPKLHDVDTEHDWRRIEARLPS